MANRGSDNCMRNAARSVTEVLPRWWTKDYNSGMKESRMPTVGFWMALVAVALALYVLLLGPSCWIASRGNLTGKQVVVIAYYPLLWLVESVGGRVKKGINWYARVGTPDDSYPGIVDGQVGWLIPL